MATTNITTSLTDDTLRSIFEFYVEDTPIIIPPKTEEDSRSTLLLVCRRWNVVAQTTQSLWSHILFLATSIHHRNTLHILQQYFTCLQRSRENLLTVEFDGGTYNWGTIAIDIILKLSNRRIKALTCTPATFHTMVDFHSPDFIIPWGQLVSLDLTQSSMTPQSFVKIMRYSSDHLKIGHFYVQCQSLPPVGCALSRNPIVMKKLFRMRLRLSHPSHNSQLFFAIQYPHLVDLYIEVHNRIQKWDLNWITPLLRSSGNSLLHLRLCDFTQPGILPVRRHRATSHLELEELLELVPNLRTLVLPLGVAVHACTIEGLASCRLLKHLSSLELAATSGLHILSMIRRRAEHAQASHLGLGSSREPAAIGFSSALDSIRIFIPWHCHEALAGVSTLQHDLLALGFPCHIRIRLTHELPLATGRRI